MLTILDAKDSSGNPVAAWYDSTNKRFIVGKSAIAGQMDLLTIAGKMAWFHQAGQPGLLFAETMPGDPTATVKHIADKYESLQALVCFYSVYSDRLKTQKKVKQTKTPIFSNN